MPLIAVRDAAHAFQCPPGTIRRWIHEDQIEGCEDPALKGHPGRRKVYPALQLQEAYERRRTAA